MLCNGRYPKLKIRERIARTGSDITDDHFINAIVSTILERLGKAVSQLQTTYKMIANKTGDTTNKLTVKEVIDLIRAEAHKSPSSHNESANYASNNKF